MIKGKTGNNLQGLTSGIYCTAYKVIWLSQQLISIVQVSGKVYLLTEVTYYPIMY